MQKPRFLPGGDRTLVVEFGDTIDPAVNRRVRDLFLALQAAPFEGIIDLIPTYRSLLVQYDPLHISYDDLHAAMQQLESAADRAPVPAPRLIEIPTAYGGDFGPDLSFVAEHNGLSESEVVEIHAGTDYLVYMMGFSPGFPYLGGMSSRIATPRLKTPRTVIPAGSVGIAQSQTGIYPVESPGGWQLIGRTPVPLFAPHRKPPVLVEAGDYLRFVPVSVADYEAIAQRVADGTWTVTVRERPEEAR